MADEITLEGDVLVVGGGGAGMFAAVAAARNGARVLLLDKNVVGRGGATIMAQMTCASALGEAEPDNPQLHLEDTLSAGRGLCNENLAALLVRGKSQADSRARRLEGQLGAQRRRQDQSGQGAGPQPQALCLCRLPEHGRGDMRGAAQQDQPRREHPPAEQCQRDRHRGP